MWKKLGKIYEPTGKYDWRYSHGFTPTALELEDRIRIYVGFWAVNKKCRIGYLDVDKNNPTEVLNISENPIIDLGEPGFFDHDAMIPSCAYKTSDGRIKLMYTGWQKLIVSCRLKRLAFSGILIGDEDNNFERYSKTPWMDRTEKEPYFRAMPWRVRDNLIYYISSTKINKINNFYVPEYSVVIPARRKNQDPIRVIPIPPGYLSVARPCVLTNHIRGGCDMWVSLRRLNYGYDIITHAYSADGYKFEFDEGLYSGNSILPSEEGWDSEMVCFPNVIDLKDHRYMFYCGNQYGKTGFGVAKWV